MAIAGFDDQLANIALGDQAMNFLEQVSSGGLDFLMHGLPSRVSLLVLLRLQW